MLNMCPFTGHSYCMRCIQSWTLETMNRKALPCCPMASECKFQYDLNTVSKVLSGMKNSKMLVLGWHELYAAQRTLNNPLFKQCPVAGCEGCLKTTPAGFISDDATTTYCDSCGKVYCWTCVNPTHQGYSCREVKEITARWYRFIENMGQGSVNTGEYSKEGFKKAFSTVRHVMESNAYFLSNIENGLIKACTNCNRIIERTGGCDHMVCGRNADGVSEPIDNL
jgi:hypothetical protein